MIELLSTAEMAEADRLTIAAGGAGIALMENAGHAVADGVASRHPAGTRVAIVAGPGHNGGDGFVAARLPAGRGDRGSAPLSSARLSCWRSVCVASAGCWPVTARGSRAMRPSPPSAGAAPASPRGR